MQRLNQGLGLHVDFVLDRFEEYLALPPHAGEVAQFANERVEAVANQELPAAFRVSMDEAARPRLECLRARLPGFGDNVLRFSPVSDPPNLPPEFWLAIAHRLGPGQFHGAACIAAGLNPVWVW